MPLDLFYFISKLKRLAKARYEVAKHRGELTLANALRVGGCVIFVILAFSFGAVKSDSSDGKRIAAALSPSLIAGAALPPKITAESAYIIDPASRFVLYDKNSTLRLPPASATKIAAALVAMSHYDLDENVQVYPGCAFREGESLMGLFPDERISVRNLLRGMLIVSGSDAACALATFYPGGESSFVEEMNATASSLGIGRTHFTNPIGTDDDAHYSTAQELTALAWKALNDPFFKEAVGTADTNIASSDGKRWHHLKTTNKLLGTVPGFLGVKTGYTPKAKEVFVFYFKQGEVELVGAVMGSDDRFGDTQALLNWILSSFIFP